MIVAMSAWLRGISTSGWRDPPLPHLVDVVHREVGLVGELLHLRHGGARRSATIRLESPRRVRTGSQVPEVSLGVEAGRRAVGVGGHQPVVAAGAMVRYCSRSVLVVVPTSR
jgi:hypothetical protein